MSKKHEPKSDETTKAEDLPAASETNINPPPVDAPPQGIAPDAINPPIENTGTAHESDQARDARIEADYKAHMERKMERFNFVVSEGGNSLQVIPCIRVEVIDKDGQEMSILAIVASESEAKTVGTCHRA